jgi:NAD(P)-dependent dehydrogenase (short-subunit alcohol dehydrogenase family)
MAGTKKVALITGANKGLGLEIARQLGREGVTVVIGARDIAKGQTAANTLQAEGLDAHAVKIDVTSAEDIAALPAFFATKFGGLDILINNAGVMKEREGEVNAETLRSTFEANVIGPFAVTQALLPLLKASLAGRIVNHSSILGSLTVNSAPDQISTEWLAPAYNSSKAALNMLTIIQARQLADTKIKVNAAHPGWVKTDLGTDAAPMETPDGAKTAVRLALLPEDGPSGGYFHMNDTLPW